MTLSDLQGYSSFFHCSFSHSGAAIDKISIALAEPYTLDDLTQACSYDENETNASKAT